MKFEKELLFKYDDKEFIILTDLMHEDTHYCFCNQFINDEPTDVYILFKEVNNTLVIVEDLEEVKRVVPLVEKLLGEEIEKGE